jgi:hypothetical protein
MTVCSLLLLALVLRYFCFLPLFPTGHVVAPLCHATLLKLRHPTLSNQLFLGKEQRNLSFRRLG